MAISTSTAKSIIRNTGNILLHSASDLLASSDFISRTIGMANSYEDIMLLVQSLGREPVSLLGKDYLFIFDHVRRNYEQGTTISSVMYGVDGENYWCPKFTFYKEKPTVRFANPYADNLNLLDRWFPNFTGNTTKSESVGFFYAESNDGSVNNKVINSAESNMGTASGQYSTSFQNLASCDLIRKSNANFRNGKFNTLIARFHTNEEESKDLSNPTQTAISKKYGMSHGRNLLKMVPDEPNGYDNPYCRVWTYHHQYHRIVDAIRPFADGDGSTVGSAKELEQLELSGDYGKGGFRTLESKNYDVKGGSERLDLHGVLNYENGFVNIAPTAKIKDYFEHKSDDKDRKSVSIKKCMFSIENLAWRDEKMKYDQFEPYGLSAEQRGPLGGRIMWFPPYDISFNESVSVKWNPNEFIGRGENIYTYTNTERNGNLSFTLLIDHPSILDYWTGHERNGMKNKGQTLLPGNTDGVDGKDNQENTLLRFFAGCDILTAKPQEYWMRDVTPENAPDKDDSAPEVPNENVQGSDENKPKGKQVMCCVLYFPNNYSGINDKPGNMVSAIDYLMNGIGAQKLIAEKDISEMGDIPTFLSRRWQVNGYTDKYGGYEIDKPITVVTEPLENNKEVRQSTYTLDRKAEFLTNKTGKIVVVDNESYMLGKIIGSKALSYDEVLKNLWHTRRWYYRVDEGVEYTKNNGEKDTYENDSLKKAESYLDTTCFKLNREGYKSALDSDSPLADKIKEGVDNDENLHLISFSDLFYALEQENKVIEYVDEKNVDYVKKLMEADKNGIKIEEVSFIGCASKAGHKDGNDKLAHNRGTTLKDWLSSKGFPTKNKDGKSDAGNVITYPSPVPNDGDANSKLAKLHRCAMIKIVYEYESTENASSQDSAVQTTKDAEGKTKPVTSDKAIDPKTGEEKTVPEYTLNKTDVVTKKPLKKASIGTMNTARDWLYNTPEGREVLRTGYTESYKDFTSPDGKTTKIKVREKIDPKTFTMADASRLTGKDYFNSASTNYDDSYMKRGITVKQSTVKRYDNEGEFFELLDKESPFLHHLITDKIKYFDPAYHAISPEGFNARLTFLHQCTRQGPTIGNSDPNVQTAYNLAFGRPPVCVLRIGDFYYTKILIHNMSITYDEPQWDLNPEGIGVMPMFAKINLDFHFIGGSDLAGPIARLQNAASFNYYANTSVYDNRAERVEYDPTGTGKEIKYKPYNYPDGTGRNTADGNDLEDV